jgi:hypothetical protein
VVRTKEREEEKMNGKKRAKNVKITNKEESRSLNPLPQKRQYYEEQSSLKEKKCFIIKCH